MRDDNLPKLVVCQSLSVMQGVTYERQFEWFVRQSEDGFYGDRPEAEGRISFCLTRKTRKNSAVDHFLRDPFPCRAVAASAAAVYVFMLPLTFI